MQPSTMLPRLVGSLLPRLADAAASARTASCAGGAMLGTTREYSSNLALVNQAVKAGPGGRSSISGVTATVFGANGFVGGYVVNELARRGAQVIVPYRCTENGVQHLKQMGDLGQIVLLGDFNIRDEEAVRYATHRSNVVVNLVGQRIESMNYGFDDVHVKWPATLAKIVAASPHVERLIHFSEMAASPRHASRRLVSKAAGDAALLSAVPSATILRPGAVVGIEDHFYNYMIYQLSFGVVAPVVDTGAARLQPTWVHDVAEAVTAALKTDASKGKTYYLGGPETLTIRQIYDLMIRTLRLHTDDTLHVPKPVAAAMYGVMDALRRRLPSLPMDNYFSSRQYVEEATADALPPPGAPGYAELGINPTKVTEGLPMEPVRHFRKGGYRWGDMATVAKDVPESIRKYYNLH